MELIVVHCEGWLHKRGPTDSYQWKRRWFALSGSGRNDGGDWEDAKLQWYDDETKQEVRGDLALAYDSTVHEFSNRNAPGLSVLYVKKNGFTVDPDPSGGKNRQITYHETADKEESKEWVDALATVIDEEDLKRRIWSQASWAVLPQKREGPDAAIEDWLSLTEEAALTTWQPLFEKFGTRLRSLTIPPYSDGHDDNPRRDGILPRLRQGQKTHCFLLCSGDLEGEDLGEDLFELCNDPNNCPKKESLVSAIRRSQGGLDKTEAVRKHLEANPEQDVDAYKFKHGNTALHAACMSGRPDMVQLLLQRGADPMYKSDDGRMALDWAAAANKNDWREVIALILDVLEIGTAQWLLQTKTGVARIKQSYANMAANRPDRDALLGLFEDLDCNGNGLLDYYEFVEVLCMFDPDHEQLKANPEMARPFFWSVDSNMSDDVDLAEFVQAAEQLRSQGVQGEEPLTLQAISKRTADVCAGAVQTGRALGSVLATGGWSAFSYLDNLIENNYG